MAAEQATNNTAKIFIVEDERIIAKDIEATINALGYSCIGSALTGEEAIDRIPLLKPDLVLMDINLKGGMSGVQAVEQLKEIIDVPIVYLTAYSDEKTLDRAKRTEPYGYILKPYEERELHSTIEMALYKHKMEKQIRHNEKWYRTILENIGEGVLVTTLAGKVTFANPVSLAITGYEDHEVANASLNQFFRLEAKNDLIKHISPLELFNSSVNGKASMADIFLVHKTGKKIPIDYLITPIKNEEDATVGIIIVFRDLTDQLKSEEALRATEYRYTTIFETARDVIYTLNNEGKFMTLNKAFVELTGFVSEEMLGKHFNIYIHPDDARTAGRHFKTLKEGGYPPVHELRVMTKTGAYRYAEITSVPLKEHGEVVTIIGIARDVTVRKEAELELIRAKNFAEQSKKYQEQFLANISHEIRTPMNAILGMSQLLLQSKMDTNQTEFINAIRLSAENLLVIINDILDLSKIQAGKMTFEEVPFNLIELINGLNNTIQFKVDEKKLSYSAIIDKSVHPNLIGDQIRINQVLLNLLGNAVKFTESGSVKLEIRQLNKNRDNIEIAFIVSDTGIGIPKDKFELIFDTFKQANTDTARKYGGTGLGLTISKQLVELMGGSITVDSEVGVGSRFTVILRFNKSAKSSKQYPSEVASEDPKGFNGLRVLVAEDNNFNKLLIKNILYGWGCEVDMADNGIIALEKLKNHDYDIVLMDIQMPEMDGYEATMNIRQHFEEPKRSIPVIAVTAHATVAEQEKCAKAGMNEFVSKPINTDKLYKKIWSLLHNDGSGVGIVQEENLLEINQSLTDLSYLQEISGGSVELMKEMIEIFINETPIMLETLEKSVKEKDWKTFREIAHKIKPSITYAGITSAEALIEKIHADARDQKNLEEIPKILPEFAAICRAAVNELTEKAKSL